MPQDAVTATQPFADRFAGDWCGAPTRLKDRGVNVEIDWTQDVQGYAARDVADRGFWGNRLDIEAILDGERLGLWPGLEFAVRPEINMEQSVNGTDGAVIVSNPDLAFPDGSSGNGIGLALFPAAQKITDDLTVTVGRLEPLLGYRNASAAGAGRSELGNAAFSGKLLTSIPIPYSDRGTNVNYQIVKPSGLDRGANLVLIVMGANNTSMDPFGSFFENGVSILAEVFHSTRLFGLPGQHTIDVAWSNRKRNSLDPDGTCQAV